MWLGQTLARPMPAEVLRFMDTDHVVFFKQMICFVRRSSLELFRRSPRGGGVLVPFQNCPMFPCSHTLSECFRTVIFRILFPCSQILANVPFDILPMFPCSPKPLGDPLFKTLHVPCGHDTVSNIYWPFVCIFR